ncbi:hypothetical protein Aab01nite_44680 [Paractinoplanes abujensis]|nr:hypothetical protein Aab01nite_44680 [Actinoplanes abujensis]
MAAAATVAAVAGLTTWLLWPEPPRQFEFVDATACLLTDEAGVTGAEAQPVWKAMQESSLTHRTRVQYLSVLGPRTTKNARVHLTSLAGSQCGVIVAVGRVQTDAVAESAAAFPQVRFLSVGADAGAGNVATASPGEVRHALDRELGKLADSAS